jgi:hypothetical protein
MDFQQAYTALDTLIKTELGTPNANTRGSTYIKTLKTHFLKSGVYTKNPHAQSLSPDLYLQACKKIFPSTPTSNLPRELRFFLRALPRIPGVPATLPTSPIFLL